jgi:hypothetical protein
MSATTISVNSFEIGNVAFAGKALEKIRAFITGMGGDFANRKGVKVEVYDSMVFITTTVKLPVSALSEHAEEQPATGQLRWEDLKPSDVPESNRRED